MSDAVIEFYGAQTSNCQKVAIMLEEIGLSYKAHHLNLASGTQRLDHFRAMNPFARVPVIVDHDCPGGAFVVVESMAILMYLAEKVGTLLPENALDRSRSIQWLVAIASNINPIFRAEDVFATKMAERYEPAVAHYVHEGEKALALLDDHVADRDFMVGDSYTIVDISAFTVAATSAKRLPRGLSDCENLRRWSEKIWERPAVKRGMNLFNGPADPPKGTVR